MSTSTPLRLRLLTGAAVLLCGALPAAAQPGYDAQPGDDRQDYSQAYGDQGYGDQSYPSATSPSGDAGLQGRYGYYRIVSGSANVVTQGTANAQNATAAVQ